MKKRKINRSLLFLILMGVIVTIVAMSVVYAALSTKLLISGSAEVQSSSWELEVKKMDFTEWYGDEYQNICVMGNLICNENIVLQGNGKVIDNPVISGTSITNFNRFMDLIGIVVIPSITNNVLHHYHPNLLLLIHLYFLYSHYYHL